MSKIIPHLWFDTEAAEAAAFYLSIFPNSRKLSQTMILDTPSGDCDLLNIELFGQEFMLISAGPDFKINSSINFFVECASKEEAYAIYSKLLENEDELETIDKCDFESTQWISDRYNVSWMIQHLPKTDIRKISPVLLFVGSNVERVEEAVDFYVSVFKNASLDENWIVHNEIELRNDIFHTQILFTLEGQPFRAFAKFTMDECLFNEGVSLLVYADSQEEIDSYWNALSAFPEFEQCGWIKDKFGVSWQISSRHVIEMLNDANEARRNAITKSILTMKKLDLAELQRIYDSY